MVRLAALLTPLTTAVPQAPTGLTALPDADSIALSWTPPAAGATPHLYKIYRNGSPLATTASTTYDDTTAAPGTIYTYTVSGIDTLGEGPVSSSVASSVAVVVTAELWENGALVASLGTGTADPITGMLQFGWDAATLAQISGVGVELRLSGTGAIDIEAVEWQAATTATSNAVVWAELWENGVFVSALGSTTIGALGEFTWNSAVLTASSGANVELVLYGVMPTDIEAVEWQASVTSGGVITVTFAAFGIPL